MINIYNDDCFKFLPSIKTNSVDLVLIDPPYCISKDTGFKNGGDKKFNYSMDFGDWDKDFLGLDVVVDNSFRVLKKGGTFICFYDLWKITHLKNYMEKSGFKQIRFLEWLKTNPIPLNCKRNYLTGAREIALLGVKGSNPVFNSDFNNGVYKYPIYQSNDRFHPTQKPVKLIEELIKIHSNENDLVLDCFSGSGTTAIACINTNRNFIGCELDINYYNKSLVRINKIT